MSQPLPLALETERVMRFANQEAQRLGHEYIGTEHILMGLTQELTGIVARIVRKHSLTLARIHAETMKCVECFPGGTIIAGVQLNPTPRAKKVLEYADEEAFRLGHMYVGIEHILLGLLRECEGIGAQVLMNLGLKLEDIREDILAELAPPQEERMLIDSLAIPNPNFARDEVLAVPNPHLEVMKIFLGDPSITDQALVERFQLIVEQIRTLHGYLIGP